MITRDSILRNSIPRLLLIGDRFSIPERADVLCRTAEAGVPWIQLRDHSLSESEFELAASLLTDRLREVSPHILISINTRISVLERLKPGHGRAFGLHLGKRGPSPEKARQRVGAGLLIGMSVHKMEQITGSGVDYYIWSPVFPTSSKPGVAGTGTEVLQKVSTKAGRIPVIALGGITPANTTECLERGAYGVAVLSGIMDADEPAAATKSYLTKIPKK